MHAGEELFEKLESVGGDATLPNENGEQIEAGANSLHLTLRDDVVAEKFEIFHVRAGEVVGDGVELLHEFEAFRHFAAHSSYFSWRNSPTILRNFIPDRKSIWSAPLLMLFKKKI